MAVGAFPNDSTVGVQHLFFEEAPAAYMVRQSQEFGDGGRDTALAAQTKTRRFRIIWDGLDATPFGVLNVHKDDARYSDDQGSAYSFNFTLPTTGETVSGVRYAKGGFKISHSKQWVNRVEVELEKLP